MTINPNAKGWFSIPGVRPRGDRTLDEQLMGFAPALAECKGKTVLDLGCAEGLIGLEFAKAGAARVVGIDAVETHLEVARYMARDQHNIEFVCVNLEKHIAAHPEPEQFDIVTACGIIHKLRDPGVCLRFAAQSARGLLCYRGPGPTNLPKWTAIVKAKYGSITCDVRKVLADEGFVMTDAIDGSRGEGLQYWRHKQ